MYMVLVNIVQSIPFRLGKVITRNTYGCERLYANIFIPDLFEI